MSRTLLEAAAVGTPVIVHDRGLIGYLVQKYQLGRVVDCTDSKALAQAVEELSAANGDGPFLRPQLTAFAARYSRAKFEEALLAAVPFPEQGGGRRRQARP
jgi:glycosyltransferase involved in cell wall biosynthesis